MLQRMLGGLFTLVIGVAALWGAVYWLRLRRRVSAWPVAPGRITERLVIQPTDRGRTSVPAFRWSPEVRYVFRVGAADYTGDRIWLPWGWTNTKEKAAAFLSTIPDDIEVRYDPADPRTSCLYAPPFSNVLWYGVPGVVLAGIGLLWTLANT